MADPAVPKLKACSPAPNVWSDNPPATPANLQRVAQDQDPGKAAKNANSAARAAADRLALQYGNQDCPANCSFKDFDKTMVKLIDGTITVVPDRPPDAAHRGQKGPFWEATASVSWTVTVYCYPNAKARDNAKDAREESAKKAKEDKEKKGGD